MCIYGAGGLGPVKVNEHTITSGVRTGSARDDHDVRSAEITKDEVI